MAYHAETSFAKGCERLSGILVDLETGKGRSHLCNRNLMGQIVGEEVYNSTQHIGWGRWESKSSADVADAGWDGK